MLTVPRDLRTKEIKSFIDDVISESDPKDFYSLDEIDQDKFSALCIRAFGCDVEIILGSDANSHLAKYFLTYDQDEAIDLLAKVKESAREHFSSYFDLLLDEELADRRHESLIAAGKHRYVDQINGEVRYA